MTEMKQYLITNCTLIDGCSNEARTNQNILIEDKKIAKISSQPISGVDAEVIDGQGKFVLPGLIDCHVHYGGTESPYCRDWVMESDIQQAMVSTAQCMKSLKHGFTTVRDISANGIYLRNMIKKGLLNGPRIVACGRGLSRTGGHGDSYEVPIEIVKRSHPWAVIADGQEEVRKAVRMLLREGSDCIKVWATGGGLWAWERETDQHYTYEELCVMVEEANYYGLPVASHCESAEGALASAKAGVTSIEHGEELSQECLEIMKEKDITLVPTIGLFFEWFSEYDPPIREGQQSFQGNTLGEKELNRIRTNFKAVYDMGIRIAVGADSFCDTLTPYGAYTHKEIHALVNAGMTPMEAIIAATKNGSILLGVNDITGTLEEGKFADLIMLEKDPLADIRNISRENIQLIMKEGTCI
ncbi:amidohydrolase family protein [Anaerovorax odorimutans]|uniref:Amidohydrolase family protein n=1 Tax=Anaerovorax odorimutans TaxID=109327 RepID=A0ABT1RR13_9FIRM|nr:amidohydrolase family protein [Anaerovorax odorimutans]MCQ4637599.1 amidohydrolase family protein [Anaerovorax odorimutans]